MLSKNKIKFITSLHKKKQRDLNQMFICEGEKIAEIIIDSDFPVKEIFATEKWNYSNNKYPTTIISYQELKKISTLKNPNNVLTIVPYLKSELKIEEIAGTVSLVLHDIRDPGNLGSIIRTADWFGIKNIICSKESVEIYNPKVIQSTMGAIFSVNVFYTDLNNLFEKMKKYHGFQIVGTYMKGENVYQYHFPDKGFLVFGNESSGIGKELEKSIDQKIHIPPYSKTSKSSESLNISSALAIICSEFRRSQMQF